MAIHIYQSVIKAAQMIQPLIPQDDKYTILIVFILLLALSTYVVLRILHKLIARETLACVFFSVIGIYIFSLEKFHPRIKYEVFMFNLVVVLIILAVTIIFLISTRKRKKSAITTEIVKKEAAYKKNTSIFTLNEQRFYQQLKSVIDILNEKYQTKLAVFTKVRVLDIIKTKHTKKLQNMHIDYILCDAANNYEYITAIELDDNSHNTDSQRKNDAHKDKSFRYIGLPLIRFRSISHDRTYSKQDIFQDIFSKIEYRFDSKHPHPLILRRGSQKWFFGCIKYSSSSEHACKYTLSIPYNLTKF
ncbi:MAG: hypothetical protein Rpha_1219 [Candidatus Ruthia sp. Apha_13_S6]|nr:hypothetical protein [Candidatus Ruthia sp. Apha_13_S6]